MNVKAVLSLRRFAPSTSTTGAAHLRWQGGKTPITHRDDVGGSGPGAPDAPLRGGTLGRAGTDPGRYHVERVRRLRRTRPGARPAAALRGLLGAVIRREPAPHGPLHEVLALAARPSGCRTSASSLPKSANVVNATRSCHCSTGSSRESERWSSTEWSLPSGCCSRHDDRREQWHDRVALTAFALFGSDEAEVLHPLGLAANEDFL